MFRQLQTLALLATFLSAYPATTLHALAQAPREKKDHAESAKEITKGTDPNPLTEEEKNGSPAGKKSLAETEAEQRAELETLYPDLGTKQFDERFAAFQKSLTTLAEAKEGGEKIAEKTIKEMGEAFAKRLVDAESQDWLGLTDEKAQLLVDAAKKSLKPSSPSPKSTPKPKKAPAPEPSATQPPPEYSADDIEKLVHSRDHGDGDNDEKRKLSSEKAASALEKLSNEVINARWMSLNQKFRPFLTTPDSTLEETYRRRGLVEAHKTTELAEKLIGERNSFGSEDREKVKSKLDTFDDKLGTQSEKELLAATRYAYGLSSDASPEMKAAIDAAKLRSAAEVVEWNRSLAAVVDKDGVVNLTAKVTEGSKTMTGQEWIEAQRKRYGDDRLLRWAAQTGGEVGEKLTTAVLYEKQSVKAEVGEVPRYGTPPRLGSETVKSGDVLFETKRSKNLELAMTLLDSRLSDPQHRVRLAPFKDPKVETPPEQPSQKPKRLPSESGDSTAKPSLSLNFTPVEMIPKGWTPDAFAKHEFGLSPTLVSIFGKLSNSEAQSRERYFQGRDMSGNQISINANTYAHEATHELNSVGSKQIGAEKGRSGEVALYDSEKNAFMSFARPHVTKREVAALIPSELRTERFNSEVIDKNGNETKRPFSQFGYGESRAEELFNEWSAYLTGGEVSVELYHKEKSDSVVTKGISPQGFPMEWGQESNQLHGPAELMIFSAPILMISRENVRQSKYPEAEYTQMKGAYQRLAERTVAQIDAGRKFPLMGTDFAGSLLKTLVSSSAPDTVRMRHFLIEEFGAEWVHSLAPVK